mmetsp:Transcript_17551/g.37958  ORF Transcript_17551/g.37958 Transcript_17551/m.37958 type:complete len:593 (+) Transcript_17551:81-1859(+)|eukprot:CAMPEP_0172529876 /NCGR_PEP_ID=MMETSP1067-20121228/3826_1 /TAXON_ID=265564 ORGANISM="Thalassiosira punctigera, Strain Tpunct2005C2" /NCGR_SAMPLE_ID=MMETSP1067 /ASSEMBLY_ACC=CAM_ASM_000444 /LENGTH=592 /DNA_ID=CAMNT_0013314005 /DNA_START=78 /DNA_END=1856 /DNA_ORIENTATION=-
MTSSRSKNEDPWLSSDEDDDDEEEIDDDDDHLTFRSVCDYSHGNPSASPAFDTVESALRHDVSHHGFNLLSHLGPSDDEDGFFEGAIVLVNKCRRFVKDREGEDGADAMELGRVLNEFLKNQKASKDDDEAYYKPVLEDDAMLMCIDEIRELKRKHEIESRDGLGPMGTSCEASASKAESETVKSLQAQVSLLEEKLAHATACIASLTKEDADATPYNTRCEWGNATRKKTGQKEKKKSPDNDTYYFSSYSNTSIHETMLRDTVRTAAYEDAILSNADPLFRGKTVLDIGCGTGVLSLFCAKAGARKVIAVDNSDVLNQAEKIVKLNGYDHVVTCVRGKIETLLENDGLPLSAGETVDVIVSEWMGYALFFETMLPSVMAARDAVMTPGSGTMFPNVSKIFIEGGTGFERLAYWDDVHSLDMSPMKERMVSELTNEAWVEVIEDENIVTNRTKVMEHDLNACKDDELDFEAPFELRLRDGASSGEDIVKIHQLVVSFDIEFSVPGTNAVSFTTGCQGTPTHWKQTVLWFDPLHNCPGLSKGRGDVMRGTFRMRRNAENHRAIDIAVSWETGRNEDDGWARTMDGVLKRSLIA